jgi:hypothetical protein
MSELRSCGFGNFAGFEIDKNVILMVAAFILLCNPYNIVDEAKVFLTGLGIDYTTLIWLVALYFLCQSDIF